MSVLKFIDLSQPIEDRMFHFPGDPVPRVKKISSIEEKGWSLTEIYLGSHSGTHLDSPAHAISGGKTIDELPLDKFFGDAVILDVSARIHGDEITPEDLEIASKHLFRNGDIALLYTGMYQHWGDKKFLKSYPYLTLDSARWLVERKVKLIGIDWLSVEKFGSSEGFTHKALLKNEIPIVENLTNLDKLIGRRFQFVCFPLKLLGVDGSPARAIAVLRDHRS
jgi:kynurenine formamidase